MNRDDFPLLKNQPNLIYLDSANTTLKPQIVIDAVRDYYENYSANIGRATYEIGEKATRNFEAARTKVAKFLGAKADEIIFTHSATYGLNQIAVGVKSRLSRGDVILLTRHEHNSNLLVWQKIAAETGAKIQFADDEKVELNRVKIFSFALVSNVTGEIFDYNNLIKKLRNFDALIAIDISQAVGHLRVDVCEIDCDFLTFSAHKMYGPSGVGVLYIRRDLQGKIDPMFYGSQTFAKLDETHFDLLNTPAKFEPGTPNIEGVIGLGAAVDYLQKIGSAKIREHEIELINYFRKLLAQKNLAQFLVAQPQNQTGVFAFSVPETHPHDLALALDADDIAVRAGKACADLIMRNRSLVRGVVRVSFGIYTDKNDLQKFANSFAHAIERLS